jgi:hypothetical protein
MRHRILIAVAGATVVVAGIGAAIWFSLKPTEEDDIQIARYCADMVAQGFRGLVDERADRFQGKVGEPQAGCRGGAAAVAARALPWVDWRSYWGAGDASSLSDRGATGSHLLDRNKRGIDGALLDLEYQRMELIRFNLFDNTTFQTFAGSKNGPIVKVWPEERLAADDPHYKDLKIAADGSQTCTGEEIRFRTTTGICNDIRNPAMGATGQLFERNVQFEATSPETGSDEYARNRHAGRISLMQPDPGVISRRLFTRDESAYPDCNQGKGVPGKPDADCGYRKAPFFNVLAAFWIQFMTHDWFSHLDDARNDGAKTTSIGCETERVGDNAAVPLTDERRQQLGCRTGDHMDAALNVDSGTPEAFDAGGTQRWKRAYTTSRNLVTAWWDASQLYGFDDKSRQRVKRDPADPAKLLLVAGEAAGGYLPAFGSPCPAGAAVGTACDPIQPEWSGQEATAFPDNWSVGLSFYHNLFAREHNAIVDAFRRMAKDHGDTDSGLRDPLKPDEAVPYNKITDDPLFEIARLIVAAEIAKIHTTEWTPQLLYDEPLNVGMNSNWSGLFEKDSLASQMTKQLVSIFSKSGDQVTANQLYSAFAAGAGIVGRGSTRRWPEFLPDWLSHDYWRVDNPDDVNGGTNHFGAPFNFPEEFVSVYRLHAMVPDMIEFRDLKSDPNAIREHIPVIDTFRGNATSMMHDRGLADWALSFGRQRLGLLLLQNHPQFLQNIDLRPRIDSTIDVPALDLVRDRERGVPRFNEFRRQIGLRQLTSFDDFIQKDVPADSPTAHREADLAQAMREIYGQHKCDASKVITIAQRNDDGSPINDCLGHPDGSLVDNIEDLDLVVGYHAETTRPHGFAISETQFQIFILNASRRLFSDRFFTSSFRPEFYTKLGIDWVMDNGPTGKQWEEGEPNGHRQEVSPLKRILLRAAPELEGQLKGVINAFDPWARDRGEYYSVAWKARPDAESDPAFQSAPGEE